MCWASPPHRMLRPGARVYCFRGTPTVGRLLWFVDHPPPYGVIHGEQDIPELAWHASGDGTMVRSITVELGERRKRVEGDGWEGDA